MITTALAAGKRGGSSLHCTVSPTFYNTLYYTFYNTRYYTIYNTFYTFLLYYTVSLTFYNTLYYAFSSTLQQHTLLHVSLHLSNALYYTTLRLALAMSLVSPNANKGQLQDCATLWRLVTETATKLKFLNELRPTDMKRVDTAVVQQRKTGLPQRNRKQQLFLSKVLEISPFYFLLCTIALSLNKLTATKGTVLDTLLKTIAANRDNDKILCPNLRLFAVQRGVPGADQRFGQHGRRSTLQDTNQGDSTFTGVVGSDEGDPQGEIKRGSLNTRIQGTSSVQLPLV
jgi:hypothetical protein